MEYFLEQEQISAREIPNLKLNDVTLNTSNSLGCKRLSAVSIQSASSGYGSLALDGNENDDEVASISSDSIDALNKSFYSNDSHGKDSLESFLEQERVSAREVLNLKLNDVPLNTSKKMLDGKRLPSTSIQSAFSGHRSLWINGNGEKSVCSKSIDVLSTSFLSNGTLNSSAGGIELVPKSDLELFKPTQNQAFRQNVIACDDVDVGEDDVDELNSTLERVDFILNYMDYKPKFSENSERKRMLQEYGKNIVKVEKKKLSKRTISVDVEINSKAWCLFSSFGPSEWPLSSKSARFSVSYADFCYIFLHFFPWVKAFHWMLFYHIDQLPFYPMDRLSFYRMYQLLLIY